MEKSFDGALFRAFLCLEKKWINGSPEAIHKRINSWVSSLIANSKIRSLRSKFPLVLSHESSTRRLMTCSPSSKETKSRDVTTMTNGLDTTITFYVLNVIKWLNANCFLPIMAAQSHPPLLAVCSEILRPQAPAHQPCLDTILTKVNSCVQGSVASHTSALSNSTHYHALDLYTTFFPSRACPLRN